MGRFLKIHMHSRGLLTILEGVWFFKFNILWFCLISALLGSYSFKMDVAHRYLSNSPSHHSYSSPRLCDKAKHPINVLTNHVKLFSSRAVEIIMRFSSGNRHIGKHNTVLHYHLVASCDILYNCLPFFGNLSSALWAEIDEILQAARSPFCDH